MADIYLLGHGHWDTQGASDAFTSVPRDTSLLFYTPIGRFINASQTAAIMRGDPGRLRPVQELKAYMSAPNLTLSEGLFPNEIAALLQSGVRFAQVRFPTPLAELLERYAGNRIHWLACRAMLGGKDTTEGGFNDDYSPARGIGV